MGGLAGETSFNGTYGTAGDGAGGIGVFNESLVVGLHFLTVGHGCLMILAGGIERITGTLQFGGSPVIVEPGQFHAANGCKAALDQLLLTFQIEAGCDESCLRGVQTTFCSTDSL